MALLEIGEVPCPRNLLQCPGHNLRGDLGLSPLPSTIGSCDLGLPSHNVLFTTLVPHLLTQGSPERVSGRRWVTGNLDSCPGSATNSFWDIFCFMFQSLIFLICEMRGTLTWAQGPAWDSCGYAWGTVHCVAFFSCHIFNSCFLTYKTSLTVKYLPVSQLGHNFYEDKVLLFFVILEPTLPGSGWLMFKVPRGSRTRLICSLSF